ncbi:hypothetical protein [Rugamonas rubra]|uniref:hypothetical protein n=1 Tax=Rugamonas rubra TaxID=758825 RepID=UPI0011137B04|nr:hypothetical protein [Rugamonas rubra]
MNIDIDTGGIFEGGNAIFWKGMTEKDVLLIDSIELSDFLRRKRMSFCHIETPLVIFGLIFSISIVFQDSIIKKIELRLDDSCGCSGIGSAGIESGQDPLGAMKRFFLKLLSKIENIAPNIVFLPEVGFRHKWGKIVVIENIKNFDCYIVIEY